MKTHNKNTLREIMTKAVKEDLLTECFIHNEADDLRLIIDTLQDGLSDEDIAVLESAYSVLMGINDVCHDVEYILI